MVEKPKAEDAPSNLAVIGRYILTPAVLKTLNDMKTGAGGEIQLTDAMVRLMGERDFFAFQFAGKTYDTGSKLGYLEAFMALALKNVQHGDEAAAMIRRFADTLR
jgi:UTP--glucose-1-phosphate uridylyltransferase